jgi:hypothetical protein
MQDTEVSRIAKELNMTEADVRRLAPIVEKIMADKKPVIDSNPDWNESEEVTEGGY